MTFVADRAVELNIPLNEPLFGIKEGYKILLAIVLSFFTGWLVNLGPKVSARAFGPATAAVLGLLWVMIFATIYKFGINLPVLDLKAFSLEAVRYVNEAKQTIESNYLELTLGGYARILALMTGIEIFANLVAAYDGKRAEKSRKAFGSLIIIMGTTALTMIIVGPAILQVAGSQEAAFSEVSVFTQTMNALLPPWASYLGTLIGIAVLLSASAAAAQGIQNLSLGLRYRHYIAADMGQRNKYDVAGKPVWIMIVIIALCFVAFGTHEETYLALYAAGVFILLSMTGWAACKRLLRELRKKVAIGKFLSLLGTAIASVLTSIATTIIFTERFFEGAWLYFVLIPGLYLIFSHYRSKLGKPPSVEQRFGAILAEQMYTPMALKEIKLDEVPFKKIVVPLDGSSLAEQVIPTARAFAREYGAELELVAVEDKESEENIHKTEAQFEETRGEIKQYMKLVGDLIEGDGLNVATHYRYGEPSTEINAVTNETASDLIIMSTRGTFDFTQLVSVSMAQRVIQDADVPTLLIRPTNNWRTRRSEFKKILVTLDGSAEAEMVLPYIRAFALRFESEVILVSVPEGSEDEGYSERLGVYLENIAKALREEGIPTTEDHTGSGPARTILALSEEEGVDLIMMSTHGRGGTDRAEKVPIGSVAAKVVKETPCPVFVLPLHKDTKVFRNIDVDPDSRPDEPAQENPE